MVISVCKSDYFIDRSREVFLSCIAERSNKQAEDNFYSQKFLDVFIFATTALEAFINERISISLLICKRRLALNDPVNQNTVDDDRFHIKILNRMKKENLREKYLELPRLLWNTKLEKNEPPYHDFEILVKIRNDIIHYKMPFYDEENFEPSWVSELSKKGFFMNKPVIVPPEPLNEKKRIWIEEICTLKSARWAHNTTCATIKQFCRMSKGVIQLTIDDYADYFAEL